MDEAEETELATLFYHPDESFWQRRVSFPTEAEILRCVKTNPLRMTTDKNLCLSVKIRVRNFLLVVSENY